MKTIIIGGSNSQTLAKSVARTLRKSYSAANVKQFPDGETYLRLMTNVKGAHVVYIESMHPQPNQSMIESIFALTTAKELGAKKTTLVAPYLAYMRQDKRFRNGECMSNHIMATLLHCADRVLTIDPHLHRVHHLSTLFPRGAKALSANHTIADWIKKKYKKALIIGPDAESYQWAEHIAQQSGNDVMVLKKKRYSSRVVRIKVQEPERVKGKHCVIVDDIISTGHTMMEPITQLKKYGAKSITCVGVHGLFMENALAKLKKLGAKVYCSNTIVTPTNKSACKIDVSEMIAKALH